MAGTRIIVDTRELEAARKRLDGLANFDRAGLLDAIGAEGESQTRRRIEDEKTGPEGQPWDPWAPRYARTRHGGHSLLMGEGDLLDSIQYLVAGGTVEWGSNLVYAAIHQFGGEEIGMPGLPARPYLGLNPENETELLAVVNDFLDEALA
ncbi:MAG TPA: phage virion morphogenesis protein [bacterium]|jgi:phage virion morphogenesis protein